MSIYTSVSDSCLMKKKTRQYSTATNTIYAYVRFIYEMGAVLYVRLYQCWSSLDSWRFTVGADIILYGNVFQLFISLLLKQCCRIVV